MLDESHVSKFEWLKKFATNNTLSHNRRQAKSERHTHTYTLFSFSSLFIYMMRVIVFKINYLKKESNIK